jgi:hypothetical protein
LGRTPRCNRAAFCGTNHVVGFGFDRISGNTDPVVYIPSMHTNRPPSACSLHPARDLWHHQRQIRPFGDFRIPQLNFFAPFRIERQPHCFVTHNADELLDSCNPFLGHVTHRGRQAKIRIHAGNIPRHKNRKRACPGQQGRPAPARTTEWVVYRLQAGNRAILDKSSDSARDLNSFVKKHCLIILRIV